MNLIETINHQFTNFLKTTFNASDAHVATCQLTLNVDEAKQDFGDLNSNAAMVLSKSLKQNPRDIAQEIIAGFKDEYIASIVMAGPGFLNVTLTDQAFKQVAQELYKQKDSFFKLDIRIPKKNYSLEFVSANPTGPLHIGHGRGGIIGDVLGNILKFLGHQATKEYYINDAGAQIHKLGISLKIRCRQLLGEEQLALPEDSYHGDYLIDLARECIQEFGPSVITKATEFFGDYGKTKLLEHIKQTLTEYGITFDVWFSEKTLHVNGYIDAEIQKLQEKGYIYEQDDALWFKSTDFGDDKDRVVKKASGELTYVAADIAYLDNRIDRGFDKLIYVLGQDHHSYATRLNAIIQAKGFNPSMLDVILYQLVSLHESGELVRMSKRAGRIVTLKDVIEAVGKDMARFFYLHRKADAHLDFDIDLALKKTEENPVYYIQYAYVRMGSILEKAQEISELDDISDEDLVFIGQPEKMLLKKIISLKELLHNISHNYQTHLLTYYIIELAHTFHSYYAKNRVIDPAVIPQSRARLVMIKLLRETFSLVFDLLGISKPEQM